MRTLFALALLALWAGPLRAQNGWPDLDQLLSATLAPGQYFEVSFWLPDSTDPAQAQQVIGVVYPVISGAAGNTGIAVGHFVRVTGGGWRLGGVVRDLFGQNPRDARFAPGSVQITTTMLGPNEPRCCPTLPVRWQIDLSTLQAQRFN